MMPDDIRDLIPLIKQHVEGFTISWLPEYGYSFSCRLKGRNYWSNPLLGEVTSEDKESLAKILCHAVVALVPLQKEHK